MSLGIYLHIPFCRAKCRYCDFNSYPGMFAWQGRYIDALCREVRDFAGEGTADTVYFGGGTPTALDPEELLRALRAVGERFRLTAECEITAECNPATIDAAGLLALRRGGVNRLSIGLQSSWDAELAMLGRIHSFRDFRDCFQNARRAGFENLSLDLIFGLPGQTGEKWRATLERALEFAPEHISCYCLSIEEGTPFARMDLELPDDDTLRELYDLAVNYLAGAGYTQYEISNFSRPGRESRHNQKYWQCRDYAGFGAGAHGCIGERRYQNLKGIPEYCRASETRGRADEQEIFRDQSQRMSEFCFLGLRMNRGISREEFQSRFGATLEEVYGPVLEKNLRRGTLVRQGDWLRIPQNWLFVSNSILADFV